MSNLADLGYFFDDQGVLRTKEDNEKFKFTTQEAYETLGEAVDEEIFNLLETRCGLERKVLKPAGIEGDDEDFSFYFASKNLKTAETMLILMHGSGVVRAGQWARRLIINENLECGTQIPYVERALKLGWAVVVMNTNANGTDQQEFKFSRTPEEHAEMVFKMCVGGAKLKSVYVVAHSRGGYDLSAALKRNGSDDRIQKICLTDSPWFRFPKSCEERKTPLYVFNFLARGKYSSSEYEVHEYQAGRVTDLYAGTKIHEWSSHMAIDAVFKIFETELNESNFVETVNEAKYLVLHGKEKEDVESDEPSVKKMKQ
ncbi:hypothetical protein CRE_25975 [Caenorhabditis remanei]|uniref:Arb2 domain-containing protein n=1 Tax=Caenorhabditis remanei TaxID=31234 RepID=E3NMZ9_CAERE|nr:hypothetical protein CRE_25975 [Caenorhabditis remanei]